MNRKLNKKWWDGKTGQIQKSGARWWVTAAAEI